MLWTILFSYILSNSPYINDNHTTREIRESLLRKKYGKETTTTDNAAGNIKLFANGKELPIVYHWLEWNWFFSYKSPNSCHMVVTAFDQVWYS